MQAPVRPRVIGDSGDDLLLEDEIQPLLDRRARGVALLLGPAGSGKSTALAHLAATLPDATEIIFQDDVREADEAATQRLVLWAVSHYLSGPWLAVFRLAPWGNDEVIEYLLAAHVKECKSVMARVTPGDRALLGGVPELWRLVLDRLAADLSLADGRSALVGYLHEQLPSDELWRLASERCLKAVLHGETAQIFPAELLGGLASADVLRVLRQAEIQLMLAAEHVVADIQERADTGTIEERWPRPLFDAVVAALADDGRVVRRLR
jgi:hypothetical protein